jgi:ComF family protein
MRSEVWSGVRRAGRELLRAALDLLLPPVCPGCGEPAEDLCGACDQNLVRRSAPGCVRCGEPVLVAGASCGGEHRELRLIAHLVAPWRFAGTGGALVRRFKLDGDAGAGHQIARAMAAAWRRQLGHVWNRAWLVPVPLHRARRRERGFDQAEWLARELARRLGYVVAPGALRRTRATRPQGDPCVTSREGNVAGAFAVRRARDVAGRDVVLVDDVFTSGATARECAALLRTAGARRVAVLTACRS